MALYAYDTFSDTAGNNLITQHTGEVGATWKMGPSSTGTALISTASRVYISSSGNYPVINASGVPATNEYDVLANFHKFTAVTGNYYVVWGRTSTVTAENGYVFSYDQTNARWELQKSVAGATTSLGTYAQALTDGVSYGGKLEIRTVAKKVYIDTVERISSADDAITDVGKGAVAGFNATAVTNATGIHLDNFKVEMGGSVPVVWREYRLKGR